MMIYNEGNEAPLPNLDLITYLFESRYIESVEDTPVFAEAKHPERTFTKADVRTLTKQFAYFLRHHFGIGSSGVGKDVVVTLSAGQSALPTFFYGVIAAGGVYSAASTGATESDLARQIKDGPGRVVVCSKDRRELAVGAARAARVPLRNVLILESWPEVRLYSADRSVHCDFKGSLEWKRITDREELENTTICILYSSGTTGLPKGVLISHMNLLSATHIPSERTREEKKALKTPLKKVKRRTLAHLPSAHIAGLMANFLRPFVEARLVYWMPSFDFATFLRHCDELEITTLITVPPIWMMMAKHSAVKRQFRHVLHAVSGAAPMSREQQEAVLAKIPNARLDQTWGMSETTGGVTRVPLDRTDAVGSVGALMQSITMRLVDDDEKDVQPGQPGEGLIKGPMITKGYHNNPEANKAAFTPDGWLRTGDIFRIENGLVYIVDRKKELIKYKATQVAPAELEGILSANPAVEDVGVIGVQWQDTEAPRAYVVLTPAARGRVTEADIAAYVAARVSSYKRLRGGVRFVDAIPRSATGKILRKDLKALQKREDKAKL